MNYTEQDRDHFCSLLFPLFNYMRGRMAKSAGIPPNQQLTSEEIERAAYALWQKPSVIDDYLAARLDLSQEDRKIVRSWKRRISGRFLVPHIQEDKAVFLREEGDVYLVRGLPAAWEEFFGSVTLPWGAETTLLPYKNCIVCHGLLTLSERGLSRKEKREIREYCRIAKMIGKFHRTI